MLELVVLSPAFGMRNVSPYCVKAEMLLKSLDLPFKLSEEADPRKAPKGKLPYLIADGQKIADSELITEYLNELTDGKVYQALTPQQSAQGLAIARLCEGPPVLVDGGQPLARRRVVAKYRGGVFSHRAKTDSRPCCQRRT